MNKTIEIPVEYVRKLSVIKQGLHQRPINLTDSVVLNVIKNIGLIQLDSITIVQRSHYIVMFSRIGKYDTLLIDKLQFPENKLLEQWVHVASLIPTTDFEEFSPLIIERRKQPLSNRQAKVLGTNYEAVLEDTLSKIKSCAPISSKNFKEVNPNSKDWWSKKPSRVALDVLFRRGYISVPFRKNFTCHYDILEKVTKLNNNKKLSDFHEWVVMKSIEAMGAASVDHIGDYYRIDIKFIRIAVGSLLKRSKIRKISVSGIKEPFYTTEENINLIDDISKNKIKIELTTVLSPFDNLIWHRGRTQEIFNFFYRSEMYTPAVNRTFGYYVLPILHNSELVGRVDLKFERKTKTLVINGLFLETTDNFSNYTLSKISAAIVEFSEFLNADIITLNVVKPDRVKPFFLHEFKMQRNK